MFFLTVPLYPVIEYFCKAVLILLSPAKAIFLVTSFPAQVPENFVFFTEVEKYD